MLYWLNWISTKSVPLLVAFKVPQVETPKSKRSGREVEVPTFADVGTLRQWPGYENLRLSLYLTCSTVFYVCVVKAHETAGLKPSVRTHRLPATHLLCSVNIPQPRFQKPLQAIQNRAPRCSDAVGLVYKSIVLKFEMGCFFV